MKKQFFYLFSLLTVMSACKSAYDLQTEEALDVIQSTWAVQELYGQDVDSLHLTMVFQDSMRVGGFSGCNHYFGSYKMESEKYIRFSAIGSTKMFCQGDPGLVESDFFRTLQNGALKAKLKKNSLRFYVGRKVVMKLERQAVDEE